MPLEKFRWFLHFRLGNGEQRSSKRRERSPVAQKESSEEAAVLFLHRNPVGGSPRAESADDLLLDVSDDELWHSHSVLAMIAAGKGVWHRFPPSRQFPRVTQREPDRGEGTDNEWCVTGDVRL